MPKKLRPPYVRAGVIALDTPPVVLDVARTLPGWAYATSVTTQDVHTRRVRCELHLAHRGGFIVPHHAFRAVNGGWRVTHVHSHVSCGHATVWLHLERVP